MFVADAGTGGSVVVFRQSDTSADAGTGNQRLPFRALAGTGGAVHAWVRRFDGAASPVSVESDLALSGSVSAAGDIEITDEILLDVDADPIALAGSVAVAGDIEITPAIILDLDSAALELAGSVSIAGDLEIGTSFDVEASTVALSGTLSVVGDVQIGSSFDLAIDPIIVTGVLALSGDLQSSDVEPPAPAPPQIGGVPYPPGRPPWPARDPDAEHLAQLIADDEQILLMLRELIEAGIYAKP